MKKLLLILLVLAGMVSTANAYDDIYLRTDYKGTSVWDEDNPSYKFTYKETNASNEDVYEMTINASDIKTSDVWFRLHISRWGAVICPYTSGSSHSFSFVNGKDETYGAKYEKTYYQGTSLSFGISHSTIKASEYKITIYRGNNTQYYQDETCKVMWIKVEIVSMPLEIKSVGAATFSCNRALNFSTLSASVQAYTITAASGGALTKSSALTTVPTETGLYIEGVEGSYDVPVIPFADADGSGEAFTKNMLIKQLTSGSVSQTEGTGSSMKTNYILTNKTTGGSASLKFYKVNSAGNTVGAGKAYLQIPTPDGVSPAPDFFDFNMGGETTGINAVDGSGLKVQGSEVYNLNGQRVLNPTKGLYIVNGKKVILK
jgi:hypothetical protein